MNITWPTNQENNIKFHQLYCCISCYCHAQDRKSQLCHIKHAKQLVMEQCNETFFSELPTSLIFLIKENSFICTTLQQCWSKTPRKNSHFVAGNVQYDNFSKSLHISRKVSSQYQILRKMEYFLTTTGTNCIISVNHVYVTFYTKCPFVVSIQNKGGDEIIILVQWVISGCWGQER